MTDTEKAKKIAENCSVMPPSTITHNDVLAMTENAAMQMAELKDENFDSFLDYLIVLENKDVIEAICDYRGKKLEE